MYFLQCVLHDDIIIKNRLMEVIEYIIVDFIPVYHTIIIIINLNN